MPRLEPEPLDKKAKEHVIGDEEQAPVPPGPPTETFASEVPTYVAGAVGPAVSTVGSEDPTFPGGVAGPSLSTVGSEVPLLQGRLVGSRSGPYEPEPVNIQGPGAQAEGIASGPLPSGGSLTSAGLLGTRYSDTVPPDAQDMLDEERGGGETSAAQLEELGAELEQQDVAMDVDEDLSPKDSTSKTVAKVLNKIGSRFQNTAEQAARRTFAMTDRSTRVDPVSAWHKLTSQQDTSGEALPIFPPNVMETLLRQTRNVGASSSYSQAVSGGKAPAVAAAAVPVGGSQTPADVQVKEEEDDEPTPDQQEFARRIAVGAAAHPVIDLTQELSRKERRQRAKANVQALMARRDEEIALAAQILHEQQSQASIQGRRGWSFRALDARVATSTSISLRPVLRAAGSRALMSSRTCWRTGAVTT